MSALVARRAGDDRCRIGGHDLQQQEADQQHAQQDRQGNHQSVGDMARHLLSRPAPLQDRTLTDAATLDKRRRWHDRCKKRAEERRHVRRKLNETAKGVYIIAATPFTDDGALDLQSVDTLTDFYLRCGVHGFTLLGMMGEAHKLTADESIDGGEARDRPRAATAR